MKFFVSSVPNHRNVSALIALALLMFATRMEHFGDATHLPDASLAVFALAGWAGASGLAFLAFLALAVGIDIWAVTMGGVAVDFFTPAYPALALAYGVLFAFGRSASVRKLSWRIAAGMLASLAVAFAISNGSFFLLSGLYPDMQLRDYVMATVRYAPAYIGFGFFYVLLGVAVAGLVRRFRSTPIEYRSGASGRPAGE